MGQKVSWPVALIVVAVLVLLISVAYRRSAVGGSEPRISPQFQQMSPAEQKAALANADRVRHLRGAP
jgi:hypothetical protein